MYLPALKSHAGAEIVAICGRDEDRARALAAEHGIPRVYTDYRDMLSNGGVDGVIVATPDDQHRAMTVDIVGAGIHVLCEKPLALNAADTQAMHDAAEAAGVLHMVMFTWRWPPCMQYFKELVDGGFVGTLYRARFAYTSGSWRNDVYEWRRDGDRANGILGDVGSHMIDLSLWMVGDISSVSADAPTLMQRSALAGRTPNSDAAHLTVAFRNGAQGIIDVTALEHQGDSLLRIEVHLDGEDGSLDLAFAPFSSRPEVWIRGVRRDETVVRELEVPARFHAGVDPADVLGIFSHHPVGPRLFVDSILGGTRPAPGFEAGLAVQEVIDAALQSHRERRWVDVT
jgi:predicted dehydrogenase